MIHFFDYFIDRISDSENSIAKGSGILGGFFLGTFFIFNTPGLGAVLTWEFLIKSLFGITISVITTMCVLIVTDLYKYTKPKVIEKFTFIKTKYFTNGKEKDTTDKERAA